jgi:hypothetical protein
VTIGQVGREVKQRDHGFVFRVTSFELENASPVNLFRKLETRTRKLFFSALKRNAPQ